MQRSYLLSIDFKVTSLTEWAAQLKMNPLYAILSGFEPGNTPGVGTFYDFINRLWDSDDDHMSPHIHPLKTKVKKPKTKGTKADSVEKVTVADLLPVLEHTDFKLDEQPYSSLFAIYQKEFLDVSASTGLIHSDALALAGDGTPVVTSHRERKKRICKCKENGITDCKCDRYFSQPDCDIGWDSSRDCYYHGYDLYMLVDSQSDLPVFPHFCCASKHDSHGFLHAFFRMKSFTFLIALFLKYFWILHMMPCLIINTSNVRISHHLSILMEKAEYPLFIKMTLRLIKTESLFAPLDAVCVVMVLRLQKAE